MFFIANKTMRLLEHDAKESLSNSSKLKKYSKNDVLAPSMHAVILDGHKRPPPSRNLR